MGAILRGFVAFLILAGSFPALAQAPYEDVPCPGCSASAKVTALGSALSAFYSSQGGVCAGGGTISGMPGGETGATYNLGSNGPYIVPAFENWAYCSASGGSVMRKFRIGDVCAATLDQPISGTVDRGSESIPPQQVCHEQCLYGLSVAEPRVGLDGSQYWYGTWVGEGQSCPGTDPPPTPGDESTEGGGPSSYDSSTSPYTDALNEKNNWLDSLKTQSLGQRAGSNSQTSSIGQWFALPSWVLGLFDARSTASCDLGIVVEGPLSSVASAVAGADICAVQTYADIYGNWFVWFCAVLWSWAIVVGAKTEDD